MLAQKATFSILGNAVLLGWLCLLVALCTPRGSLVERWTSSLGGRVVPALLATLPLWHVLTGASLPPGDLFTLGGVVSRFSDPELLLMLYFEALCFSLFVGGLIVADSAAKQVPRWLTVPSLVVLFLKGPIGVLSYASCRWAVLGSRALRLRSERTKAGADLTS